MNFYIVPDTDGKTKYDEFVKAHPLTRIVKLPQHVKDLKDWLSQGCTKEQFERCVNRSKSHIEMLIEEAAYKNGAERDAAMKVIFELYMNIDEAIAAMRVEKLIMAQLDMTKREFNAIKKMLTNGNGGKLTEPEIRDLWIERHPDTLYGLGDWHRYQDGFWPVVEDDIIEKEVMEILEEHERKGGPTCIDSHIKSVASLARRKLFIEADVWDANSESVIVCQNGVFDLQTMQVSEHKKEYYATRRLDYDYDATATCPAFMTVINSLDVGVQQFLQEFAGYCLTTRSEHEISVWMYGIPGAGKSTIVSGFETLLSEYCGYLNLSQVDKSRFALANIPGKRLLISTESPDRYFQGTAILNALISGEPLDIERKNRDVFTIASHAKLLFAMNYLPSIGSANDGIFRRVKVISFDTLPENKDETLKDRIANEGSGILNWAIEGLKSLNERGYFELPDAVQVATEMWGVNSNKAKLFVEEWCYDYSHHTDVMTNTAKREASETLYEAYKEWCLSRNYKPQGLHRMAAEWKWLGFQPLRVGNTAYWCGVALKPQSERIEYGF